MIIPLIWALINDPALFQQILVNLGSFNETILVEMNVDVLAESAGVVVANRFGIPKGLEDRIGLQNLRGDRRMLARYCGQKL